MVISVSASLYEHLGEQLRKLSALVGLQQQADENVRLLGRLLGSGANLPRTSPVWRSDVSDDCTPVEFSIAFDPGRTTLRVLVEPTAEEPSPAANLAVALDVLDSLSGTPGFARDRFDAVRDLFLRGPLDGKFSLWFSLVLSADARPLLKAYFNPASCGQPRARLVVREALQRLGFGRAFDRLEKHALHRGPLDELSFFSVDLADTPQARVKVYVSHYHVGVPDLELAALATEVDPAAVRTFCDVVGASQASFDARPAVSSYSFVAGDTDCASTFSLYHPIRSYIDNDESALRRVRDLMDRYGVDDSVVLDAVEALAERGLGESAGLIPHVSTRLSGQRRGMTVYLSSEAFRAVGV